MKTVYPPQTNFAGGIIMFARFYENPATTLQDIKETKRYARTDARTDNVKTVYPPQTKFAGGMRQSIKLFHQKLW